MCKKTCRKCGNTVKARQIPNDQRIILKCCNWYKIMTRDEYIDFDLATFDKIRFEPCEGHKIEQRYKNSQLRAVFLSEQGGEYHTNAFGAIPANFMAEMQKIYEKDLVKRTILALQHGSPAQIQSLFAHIPKTKIPNLLTELEKRELFELCEILKTYL